MHHFSAKLGRFIEGAVPGIEGHPPVVNVPIPKGTKMKRPGVLAPKKKRGKAKK